METSYRPLAMPNLGRPSRSGWRNLQMLTKREEQVETIEFFSSHRKRAQPQNCDPVIFVLNHAIAELHFLQVSVFEDLKWLSFLYCNRKEEWALSYLSDL
jgi:hypothetical protein